MDRAPLLGHHSHLSRPGGHLAPPHPCPPSSSRSAVGQSTSSFRSYWKVRRLDDAYAGGTPPKGRPHTHPPLAPGSALCPTALSSSSTPSYTPRTLFFTTIQHHTPLPSLKTRSRSLQPKPSQNCLEKHTQRSTVRTYGAPKTPTQDTPFSFVHASNNCTDLKNCFFCWHQR